MSPADTSDLADWIGREEHLAELLSPVQGQLGCATFDLDPEAILADGTVPPLWHWFHFLPRPPRSQVGPDGHARRGGFLPPVTAPRRMFAGGRLRFAAPLRYGRPAERAGRILTVQEKQGRTGPLVFVTVGYTITQDGAVCIEEEQDIVYREAGPAMPRPAYDPANAPTAPWVETMLPDPVLLFRYSALTFNGHRIHYDHPYVTGTEGYPGLIVHGPMLAGLLAMLAWRRSGRPLAGFSFRGLSPVFDLDPFWLSGTPEGDRVALQVTGPDGTKCFAAEALLA